MERPQKIHIVTCGTRGDLQPFVCLAVALKEAGYQVRVATNSNFVQFVESYDIPCAGIYGDSEVCVREKHVEAIQSGDLMKFLASHARETLSNAVESAQNWKEAFESFKPDLIIQGTLSQVQTFGYCLQYGVPVFCVSFVHTPRNPKRMVLGLPNLPFGLNGLLMKTVAGGLWDDWKKEDDLTVDVTGFQFTNYFTKQVLLEEQFASPVFPRMVVMPDFIGNILYPGEDKNKNIRFVGGMVMDATRQQRKAATEFGHADGLAAIKKFIAAGKPVFMGWGSMTCRTPEYTVVLVIRALQMSGQRAIVFGGAAELSMDTLQKATTDKELTKYAEENVLFVDKTPHEWLFPQCSCLVHHGGSGTTIAALRSGVPQIITPVWIDQYDFSYAIQRLGVGVGFDKQWHKLESSEIADALKKVCGNVDIQAKAAEVKSQMIQGSGSNGVKDIVNYVEEFWQSHVKNNRQRDAVKQMMQPKPRGGCLAFCR